METERVKVRLSICAMSTMTLKQGIERKLMEDIPDVKGVDLILTKEEIGYKITDKVSPTS